MHFHMLDGRILLLAFLLFMWTLELLTGTAITTLRSFSTRAEHSGRFWTIIIIQGTILAIYATWLIFHFLHRSAA